jgi:probable F420-dependent oxidoreductase
MDLGSVGIWWSGGWEDEAAAEMEELGYSTFWSSGGFKPGLSSRFEHLLRATKHVMVASGIVSIWLGEPGDIAGSVAKLDEQYPGRFQLGLGASHAPVVENYTKPYSRMVEYLDDLDGQQQTVPPDRRILAALGPRMLQLSAERAAGAHPYFVPVEHTAQARETLGTGPLLAPEVTVVLESDAERAREVARGFTTMYLTLPNYSNNLRALGYTEDDVAGGGSDRLVDAVVAWGDAGSVAKRVREHLDAGADHVCIQVITGQGLGEFPVAQYRELAGALLG